VATTFLIVDNQDAFRASARSWPRSSARGFIGKAELSDDQIAALVS